MSWTTSPLITARTPQSSASALCVRGATLRDSLLLAGVLRNRAVHGAQPPTYHAAGTAVASARTLLEEEHWLGSAAELKLINTRTPRDGSALDTRPTTRFGPDMLALLQERRPKWTSAAAPIVTTTNTTRPEASGFASIADDSPHYGEELDRANEEIAALRTENEHLRRVATQMKRQLDGARYLRRRSPSPV